MPGFQVKEGLSRVLICDIASPKAKVEFKLRTLIGNLGEGVTRMTGGIWQMRAIKFALRKSRNRSGMWEE